MIKSELLLVSLVACVELRLADDQWPSKFDQRDAKYQDVVVTLKKARRRILEVNDGVTLFQLAKRRLFQQWLLLLAFRQ